MKNLRTLLSVSILLAVSSAVFADRAQAFNKFPGCNDPKVLAKIVRRFNWAEKHTWQRGVELNRIERARERRTYSGGINQINRRFCRGHARLSNGRHPNVHYLIEQRMGFASISWNVEFCVAGQDRWKIYSGNCRPLRR